MAWSQAKRYQLLLRINNAIINQTSREDLFRTLAREMRHLFSYDRFSINLYDPRTESLSYFAAAEGISPEGIAAPVSRPLEKGAIARMVIRSRQPVIIADMSQHTYWASVQSMREAGLNATLAFPLIVRGRILGSLHLSFGQTPDNFEDLADFLEEVSSQVAIAVDNMLAHTELKSINERLERQKRFLLDQADDAYALDHFFFASPAMVEIMRQAELIADTDASILITGETGTGKDYIARCLHNLSPRREALFVKVNCPALAPNLFESELFGHAKGAFTGAHSRRLGRFEMADGGTVFLDEIGDLPPALQAKLLHVLQDRTFERLGDSRSIQTDFRVIAASNHDLEEALRENRFRPDLYYRLNTINLRIPPLRERLEDIPLLVDRLTAIQSEKTHRPSPRYTSAAMDLLHRHPWPGNVRELKNLVKRMVILRPGEVISAADLNQMLEAARHDRASDLISLAEMERRHIERALLQCRGAVGGPRGAARLLGLPRTTLQYRMRKYGLAPTRPAGE